MFRNKCLICGSSNIKEVIDLGMHPFADTFVPDEKLSTSEPVYPLKCSLCKDCGNVQAMCVTDPKQRYSLYDYSYTSSNSEFSRNHWKEFCETVCKKLNLKDSDFVVEIGSNDGFLCKQFMNGGFDVIGIDASKCLAAIAEEQGVNTIVGLFENISLHIPKPKIIIANNVLNHSNNPLLFIKKVSKLLDDDGFFVCEVLYWFDQFTKERFDQIYHEHVSYFTVTSLHKLFEKNNMKIIGIEHIDYHGGSLRVYAQKGKGKNNTTNNIMNTEVMSGIFNENVYKVFMNNIKTKRNNFLLKLYELKAEGNSFICVGAAAKGNTVLNFYKLDSSIIDFVTDSSMFKQGKYTPLSRIPITSDNVFANYKKVCAVILAWNISTQLNEKLEKINRNIKYIWL
jgi:SAM-dependent methyltransferase